MKMSGLTGLPSISIALVLANEKTKADTIKKHRYFWMASHIPRLLLFPLLTLLGFAITVFWFSNGDISRHNYWAIQVEWFTGLNAWLSSWPVFWANMTELGDALVMLPLLSFLIVRHPRMWAAFFGAIPLGTLLSIGGKHLIAMPRPAAVLDPGTFVVIGQTLKSYNSLPSGHTITVFTCMTVILLTLVPAPRGWRQYTVLAIGFAIACLMALSRVAVGAHWPLDVVAGAALGYLAGLSGILLTYRYQCWWRWLEVEKYRFISGLVMFFWCISLTKEAFKPADHGTFIILIASFVGVMSSLYLFRRPIGLFFKSRFFIRIASLVK